MRVTLLLILTLFGFSHQQTTISSIRNMIDEMSKTLEKLNERASIYEESKKKLEEEFHAWGKTYLNEEIPKFKVKTGELAKSAVQTINSRIEDEEKSKVVKSSKDIAAIINERWFKTLRDWVAKAPSEVNHVKLGIQRAIVRYDKWIPGIKERFVPRMEKVLENEKYFQARSSIGIDRSELVSVLQERSKELQKVVKHMQDIQFDQYYRRSLIGNSGIKQLRIRRVGLKSYFSHTFTGQSIAAIHDHSNNQYTVGMGEFIGVLNGIEFRTRHNDYRLKQPPHAKFPDKLEFVKLPDVPPAVLSKNTLKEQIIEMREWFKAFRDQKHDVRDYRPYFKPVLVYLEGMWTATDENAKLDEPFDSDRHFLDAKDMLDLEERIRFTSYTGSKSALENLAHLPTKISSFQDGSVVLSQWNYRISCHVIENMDLPLDKFKIKYDITAQMQQGESDENYAKSRNARFTLEGNDFKGEAHNEGLTYTLMDRLMEQVPGRDNYGANLTNDGEKLYSADPEKINTELNTGYYHRVYKRKHRDNTFKTHSRFFNDRLWVAHTTNPKISQSILKDSQGNGEMKKLRVSYAIPLEIVYLTPLHSWNPYRIPFNHKPTKPGREPEGKGEENNPYVELTEPFFYQTPLEFYNSDASKGDSADTAKDFVWTRGEGMTKSAKVSHSGVSILMRNIEGIGSIRTRYPILPAFVEGDPIYKFFEAAKEKYEVKNGLTTILTVVTAPSHSSSTLLHTHSFQMTLREFHLIFYRGKILRFNTRTANAHDHVVEVERKNRDKKNPQLIIRTCGGVKASGGYACKDRHGQDLTLIGDFM